MRSLPSSCIDKQADSKQDSKQNSPRQEPHLKKQSSDLIETDPVSPLVSGEDSPLKKSAQSKVPDKQL